MPSVKQTLPLLTLVLLCHFRPTPAPVPRCSPLYIINKLAEFSNVLSDSNPYFPVEPCEYGGPLEALLNGDFQSVFVFANPQNVPLHNFYELIWLLKTGGPRIMRIMNGEERLITDRNILNEGYQHYTPFVRTGQLGQFTYRNPTIIDNKGLYKKIVDNKISLLKKEGPDTFINKRYTFQGGVGQNNNNNGYSYGQQQQPSGYGADNRVPEHEEEEEEEQEEDHGERESAEETAAGGDPSGYEDKGQDDGAAYDDKGQDDGAAYDDKGQEDGAAYDEYNEEDYGDGFQDKKGLPAAAAGDGLIVRQLRRRVFDEYHPSSSSDSPMTSATTANTGPSST